MAIELFQLRKQIADILQDKGEQRSIDEELSPEQKQRVDQWDSNRPPKIQEAIEKVFQGKHKIVIPLEHQDDTEPPPDVSKHLATHGYTISDYQKGHATDKYGRTVSIGKALVKTGAHKDVVGAFVNDPNRSNADNPHKDLRIVISHHPHDVAGMSTGKCWSSCMNMESGANKQYLINEVSQGTHVAYLTHKDDTETLTNPLARIALKPFHQQSDDWAEQGFEHKNTSPIFRPEFQVHGSSPSSFEENVSHWAEKNYPAEHGKTYVKNDKVYNDTGAILEHHTDEELLEHQKSPGYENLQTPLHQIDKAVNLGLEKVKETGDSSYLNNEENMRSRMLKGKTVNKLYEHMIAGKRSSTLPTKSNDFIRRQGHKFNKTNLNDVIQNHADSVDDRILKNHNITKNHIDLLDKKQGEGTGFGHQFASSIAEHAPRFLTEEHIDRVVKASKEGALTEISASMAENMKEHHIKAIMDQPAFAGLNDTMEHRRFISNVNPQHLHVIRDRLLQEPGMTDYRCKERLLQCKPVIDEGDVKLAEKHITDALHASLLETNSHKMTPAAFKDFVINKTIHGSRSTVFKVSDNHEHLLTDHDYDTMNGKNHLLSSDSSHEAHVKLLESLKRIHDQLPSPREDHLQHAINETRATIRYVHDVLYPHKTSDEHINRIQNIVDGLDKEVQNNPSYLHLKYDSNRTKEQIQEARNRKKLYLENPEKYLQ